LGKLRGGNIKLKKRRAVDAGNRRIGMERRKRREFRRLTTRAEPLAKGFGVRSQTSPAKQGARGGLKGGRMRLKEKKPAAPKKKGRGPRKR